MDNSGINRIEELLNLPKHLSLSDFETYLVDFLDRRPDNKLALQEIDKLIALLQNHVLLLSMSVKQKYLQYNSAASHTPIDNHFFTKQEIAIKYRVSLRTVTNWIIDGLAVEEIGGVKRISNTALQNFMSSNKLKKFNWRSIAK